MALAHHIGFDIGPQSLRMAELRSSDGFPVVLRTGTAETAHDFASPLLHDAVYDRSLATEFIQAVSELLHRRPYHATSVSLTLPDSLPLVLTLPVDPRVPRDDVPRALAWECKTLSALDGAAELAVVHQLLREDADVHTYLVVAIPRATVRFLTSVFQNLTFAVRAVEMGHFVLERAIRKLLSPPSESTNAVMAAGRSFLTAGVFRGSEYRGFRAARLSYKEPYEARALHLFEELAAASGSPAIDALFLHGDAATERLRTALETLLGIPVHAFQPVERLSFLTEADAAEARSARDASIDTAVCAAWSGLP